ncbi:MAG: hypothetical protein V4674_02205 [Patescibacteria group bacterium]
MKFLFMSFALCVLPTLLLSAPTHNRPEYDVTIASHDEEGRPLRDFPDIEEQQDRDYITEIIGDLRTNIMRETVDPRSGDFEQMMGVAREESLRDRQKFKTEAITRRELAQYRAVHARVAKWWNSHQKGQLLQIISPLPIYFRKGRKR